MTIQQKLANRIYELLPHKKELGFGCEILDRKDNIQKRIAGSNGEEKVLIKGIGEIEKYKLLDISNFEIIGQPLRLADLLMAIGKLSKPLPELQLCNIQLDISKRGSNGRDNCLYNLQDDNILDQSDKFCEFVYKLLEK